MSLAVRVLDALEARRVRGAVIGASALAVHGIARATVDLDLLASDPKVLDPGFWADGPATSRIRRGDRDDPLAGVVRFAEGDEVVDLVVGDAPWMREIVGRAVVQRLPVGSLPVVEAADLILLKLYAGGPQDLLDVRLLIAARPELETIVDARLTDLPREVRQAWEAL